MSSDKTARDVLLPLAFAEEPGLPESLWLHTINALANGRTYGSDDLDRARKTAIDFLVRTGGKGENPQYRLFHRKLSESLQASAGEGSHERFVEALSATVPDDVRDSDPYVRANLASHLANVGTLENRLGDATFLLASPPDVLRRFGPDVRTSEAQRHVMSYQLSQPDAPGAEDMRAARLHLAARLIGDSSLAAASDGLERPFRVVWAHASNATPGLLLAKLPLGFRAVATARVGDDDVVIAGNQDGGIRRYRLVDGEQVGATISTGGGIVWAVATARVGDDDVVIAGNQDGGIRRYRLVDGEQVGAAGLPAHIIRCLLAVDDEVIAPFGSQLARLSF
jgi:hypothetical protein